MGVTKPYQIETRDGQSIEINLAESVSILRSPCKREEILNGEFHKVASPNDQSKITIEKPFLYIDIHCNEIILVKLPSQRQTWQEASAELQQIVNQLPNNISPPETRFMRVVFGLGELREKLLTRKAEIDDNVLELLKLWLTYEHPIFVEQPSLNLHLDTVAENHLTFIAAHEDDQTSYKLSISRQVANNLLSQPSQLKQWVSESALPKLFKYAQQVRKQQDIDPNCTNVQTMLKYLPRGNNLPNEAKKALYDLFVWAQDKINTSKLETEQKNKLFGKLQDNLFEVRFNKQLDEEWHLNHDTEDIDSLWKLLMNLPNKHIESNTCLDEINLDDGSPSGYFDRQKIFIGSKILPNEKGFENFEDLVRHEIGHAVQEKVDQEKDNLVTKWLKDEFGWQKFDPDKDSEIDDWVDLMGGYGNITDQQKKELRQYLRLSIGTGGKFGPPHLPLKAPNNHPWNDSHFGPRLACEQTGANWYQQHDKWYRINDLAFFLNYYYRVFTVVNLTTLDLVDKLVLDKENLFYRYSAMSDSEFFAELYALFYDLDDPKWGNIPRNVCDWLWDNLGAPMPITGEHYRLRNKQSKQVLEVSGLSQDQNAEVIQWTENNGDNQLWSLEEMGDGYYKLTAKHSEKVLSVKGISIQDEVKIIQDEKNGTDAQEWKLEKTEDGYCLLISKVSGMALTIGDDIAKNSTLIQEEANQESDGQKWRFELFG